MSSGVDRRGLRSSSSPLPCRLYEVYGLVVESELELPELVPAAGRIPDIRVRFGEVPEALDQVVNRWYWCEATKNEFLFTIDGIARYHVLEGRQIIVERRLDGEGSVPDADLRLWLLGSAFAAILHQRGLLPLHVSAVKAPSGVWAFTGPSGEGKSTLAGLLNRRFGWELVSDDVSVVDPDCSSPVIYPGPRKLKLWEDALEILDFSACRAVRDISNTDKFQLYLSGETAYQPEVLHGLVLLESAPDGAMPSVERLTGIHAFNACMEAIYRPYMETWFKLPERRMGELVHLCRQIHVYRFSRPRSLEKIEQNLNPLLELIATAESL